MSWTSTNYFKAKQNSTNQQQKSKSTIWRPWRKMRKTCLLIKDLFLLLLGGDRRGLLRESHGGANFPNWKKSIIFIHELSVKRRCCCCCWWWWWWWWWWFEFQTLPFVADSQCLRAVNTQHSSPKFNIQRFCGWVSPRFGIPPIVTFCHDQLLNHQS